MKILSVDKMVKGRLKKMADESSYSFDELWIAISPILEGKIDEVLDILRVAMLAVDQCRSPSLAEAALKEFKKRLELNRAFKCDIKELIFAKRGSFIRILSAAMDVFKKIQGKSPRVIRCHPDAIRQIQREAEGRLGNDPAQLSRFRNAIIVLDPGIKHGGCELEGVKLHLPPLKKKEEVI